MTIFATDEWRRRIEGEALAQGLPPDIARLIAEQCGSAETAPEDLRTAAETYFSCKVVGAVKLAELAVRSRMPLQRVYETLRDALPRSGPDRTRLGLAGIEQAKLAFIAAGVYANQRRPA